MPETLVEPLFDGPVDIVGDVHGEIQALRDLLGYLRYADDGSHPEARRLVFAGDLTDRGPDSPGVVDLIQHLVESGHAQCVLGNHDLNILLGDHKHDNHWFFGEEFSLELTDVITPAKLADDTIRQRVLDFFGTLPLALERADLRVVHACWNDDMIKVARQASDVVALYREHRDRIRSSQDSRPKLDSIDRDLQFQNQNPVKLLTSGPEKRAAVPFPVGGRMKYQERVLWWRDYDAEPVCVFGHYSIVRGQDRGTPRAFCTDFAVAKRWKERQYPLDQEQPRGLLGAVRFPEQMVVFDNGEQEPLMGPETA